MRSTWHILAALLLAGVAAAETPIPLPNGATETARLSEGPATYALPTGPFTPDLAPTITLDGMLLLRSWRWPLEAGAPIRVSRSLRATLEEQGFEVLYRCSTQTCGGFDFRFGTRVLPPPAMEVDLTDFHYIALARREPDGRRVLSVLLSRSPRGGFAQVIERVPGALTPVTLEVPTAPEPEPAIGPDDLSDVLQTDGRAVLSGVVFEPGATALAPESQSVLAQLAGYLVANPQVQLTIVGHTDTQGDLQSNIAVGRRRAAAVREALIEGFGVAPGRLEAAGAGYLAPIAPNSTEEGRAQNRRVEIVLR